MVGGRIASELPSNAARMSVSGAQVAPGRAVSARGAAAGEVSRGLAMVGFQQSAEMLDAEDLTLMTFMLGLDDLVKALVNSLVVVVLEVLAQDIAQLFVRG